MRRHAASLITVLFALGSGAASACNAHSQLTKIDQALAKGPNLASSQLQEVKKYRAEGEAQLKLGKLKESSESLAKAEKALGIK